MKREGGGGSIYFGLGVYCTPNFLCVSSEAIPQNQVSCYLKSIPNLCGTYVGQSISLDAPELITLRMDTQLSNITLEWTSRGSQSW